MGGFIRFEASLMLSSLVSCRELFTVLHIVFPLISTCIKKKYVYILIAFLWIFIEHLMRQVEALNVTSRSFVDQG